MGLFTTAKKVATGLLDMDAPSRMARSVDQGYNTDVYHGSTHNLTNMNALKTNTDSDWGQGVYSSNNIDDVNANYAGIGPDLTSRIEMEADRLEDALIDQFESKGRVKVLESLRRSMDDLRFISYKMADLDNADAAREAAEILAHKTIKGENDGVVYPLKLQIKDYAVIDQKNPTRIEGRDYQAEAADDLNRSDFGSYDDYEDALYELADDLRSSDYDSPLETISQTLGNAGVDDYAINDILLEFYDGDSISAFDLDRAIRSAEIYAEDELGNMIPNGAISAQVFRDLGYKGVKDNTVNAKFPTMEGMNPDTTHYITFPQNEQTIRSVNAQFDPNKSNSTSLLASRPEAAIGGLLAVGAMGASQDADAGQYDPASMSGVLGITPEMITAIAQRDALDQQRYGQYADDQMMPREQTYSEQLGNYLSNLRYGDDSSRQQQEMARVLGGILDFTGVGTVDALKLGAQQREAGNSFEGWLNSIGGASEAAIPAAALGYKYGKKGVQGLMGAF